MYLLYQKDVKLEFYWLGNVLLPQTQPSCSCQGSCISFSWAPRNFQRGYLFTNLHSLFISYLCHSFFFNLSWIGQKKCVQSFFASCRRAQFHIELDSTSLLERYVRVNSERVPTIFRRSWFAASGVSHVSFSIERPPAAKIPKRSESRMKLFLPICDQSKHSAGGHTTKG